MRKCCISERKVALMDLEQGLQKMSFHFSRTGNVWYYYLIPTFSHLILIVWWRECLGKYFDFTRRTERFTRDTRASTLPWQRSGVSISLSSIIPLIQLKIAMSSPLFVLSKYGCQHFGTFSDRLQNIILAVSTRLFPRTLTAVVPVLMMYMIGPGVL